MSVTEEELVRIERLLDTKVTDGEAFASAILKVAHEAPKLIAEIRRLRTETQPREDV